MGTMPDDLIPLPTMPYDERPRSEPLDVEECRTAIWRCNGNVSRAAAMIKISPFRLRNFVKNNERLKREVEEAAEVLVDRAEDVVREAMDDPDRADAMARFVLQTRGKTRGWGNGGGGGVNINSTGPISITWGDGTPIEDNSKVIDGEFTEDE